MSEVVQLHPGPPRPSAEEIARADMIAKLELFLGLAKAGNLAGLSLAAVFQNGNVATAFVPGDHLFALIGASEVVKKRLLSQVES